MRIEVGTVLTFGMERAGRAQGDFCGANNVFFLDQADELNKGVHFLKAIHL